MRLHKLLFIIALLFTCACASGQQKDTLYLHNGQILIGSIENASLGVITIDEIDLKIQRVKLYKIKRIVTFQRLRVETIDKHIYYGTLKPSQKVNYTDLVLDDGKIITMPLTSITLLYTLQHGFFKRITGSFSLGFSYTKSSGIGQFNVSSTIKYGTPRLEYQLSVSGLASIDTSMFSRDRENVALFASYNLDPTWFLAGLFQYQRNLELSIAHRYQEMVGAGKKLLIGQDYQLLGITGLAINQEKSTIDGYPETVQFEIPVMTRFNFFKFQHPNIQISTNQTIYFGITDKGRVRFDGNTSFSWQLIRYFYLDINPYTNYDNKPPSGSSNFDYGVVVSVSYKF